MTINWTEELENTVCKAISKASCSLPKLCLQIKADDPTFPGHTCIYEHIHESSSFAEKYAHAKRSQVIIFGEDLIAECENRAYDAGEDAAAAVQRSRLIVDTKKWWISKIAPKIFGDGLMKKLSFRLDLSKPLHVLAQQIIDESANDRLTLDEANAAFDVLKKFAELTKIPEFEKQLNDLQLQLNQAQNHQGVMTNDKEMDSESDQASGRSA